MKDYMFLNKNAKIDKSGLFVVRLEWLFLQGSLINLIWPSLYVEYCKLKNLQNGATEAMSPGKPGALWFTEKLNRKMMRSL